MSAPVTPTDDASAARPASAARESDAPAARPAAAARETIHHPPVEALDLALILRTVGDPLRLQMVRTLAGQGDLLCGALGDELGLPKSTSSYHLRLLREAGLTRTRQAGTQRFVSLRRADLDARFPGLVDVLTGPSEP
jgi:DNA-binding transcriptional ArsR family regulator